LPIDTFAVTFGTLLLSSTLWEQFDPAQQEALMQRLALLIVKAAVAVPHAQEHGDECRRAK